MVNESILNGILEDMFNVSEKANPNGLATEGRTTWKKFFDAKFGENPNMKDIVNELDYYFDNMTLEKAIEIYNDPEEINFWVYDRYNDGSFIMYTLYGDDDSKWETYEIPVDEILDI